MTSKQVPVEVSQPPQPKQSYQPSPLPLPLGLVKVAEVPESPCLTFSLFGIRPFVTTLATPNQPALDDEEFQTAACRMRDIETGIEEIKITSVESTQTEPVGTFTYTGNNIVDEEGYGRDSKKEEGEFCDAGKKSDFVTLHSYSIFHFKFMT